ARGCGPRAPPAAGVRPAGGGGAVGGGGEVGVCSPVARWRLCREPLPCRCDTAGHKGRAFARRSSEFLTADAGHREDEVEAVEQRARELVPVASETLRRAAALGGGIASRSAGTEIHGCDEDEPGGEDDSAGRAGDRNEAVLERLAQGLERRTLELGELVQQQHAAMREARLSGTEVRAPTDDRG